MKRCLLGLFTVCGSETLSRPPAGSARATGLLGERPLLYLFRNRQRWPGWQPAHTLVRGHYPLCLEEIFCVRLCLSTAIGFGVALADNKPRSCCKYTPHMEPVINCLVCGCTPQVVKSAEKPLGQVSLTPLHVLHTVLLTRFSRLRPVTLDLLHIVQPPPRGYSSAKLDMSNEAERQKWTTRKQLVLAHARARECTHTKWADTAHRQRQKHHHACERVVKLNTESNIVVRELVEGDCVS